MVNRFDSAFFLENIEWLDQAPDELVRRFPEQGSGEIKWGAQLTVRESQAGVLFYQGRACDAFGPGRHTLKTMNLPILTKILSLPWRGDSPLRAEIYMVSLKYFPDLKWGTSQPVAFRDSELGLVRLRAHGVFSMQIVQPVLFLNRLVGTMSGFTTAGIADYLQKVIVSRFNDHLGTELDSILNLPGRFEPLSSQLLEKLAIDFGHYGLRLGQLIITSITPPDEVQKAIDDRGRLGVIPDMDKFMRMKAAMAMEKAAIADNAAGAGVGLGMAMMLPSMFATAGTMTGAIGNAAMPVIHNCAECGSQIQSDARFCPLCGHQQVVFNRCRHCGKNLTVQSRYCPQCGKAVKRYPQKGKICKECGHENLADSLYCNNCGQPLA